MRGFFTARILAEKPGEFKEIHSRVREVPRGLTICIFLMADIVLTHYHLHSP